MALESWLRPHVRDQNGLDLILIEKFAREFRVRLRLKLCPHLILVYFIQGTYNHQDSLNQLYAGGNWKIRQQAVRNNGILVIARAFSLDTEVGGRLQMKRL